MGRGVVGALVISQIQSAGLVQSRGRNLLSSHRYWRVHVEVNMAALAKNHGGTPSAGADICPAAANHLSQGGARTGLVPDVDALDQTDLPLGSPWTPWTERLTSTDPQTSLLAPVEWVSGPGWTSTRGTK